MSQRIMGVDAPSTVTPTIGQAHAPATRALLAGGVIAGPLFAVVTLTQMAARPGFDPSRHPLSMLSLGEQGWIQVTNFVLAGLLVVGSSVGLRRALRPGRASRWGPLLFGCYGASLVWAGVFRTDPYAGYPPGSPALHDPSWHGTLHGLGPAVMGISLMAACFVLARRFAGHGRRALVTLCVATPVGYLATTAGSFATGDFRFMLTGGVLLWLWAALATAVVAHGTKLGKDRNDD